MKIFFFHRETNRRIGDLMSVLGPYLKMYTDYVKNFENASEFIDTWRDRSRDFAKMICEVTKEVGFYWLALRRYMLLSLKLKSETIVFLFIKCCFRERNCSK